MLKFNTQLNAERRPDPLALAQQIKNALFTFKVVHVKGIEAQGEMRPFYDMIAENLGPIYAAAEDYRTGAQTGMRWSEIRYDHDIPDEVAYRHSKNAQPMHTDCSYIENPPNIMFIYCVNQAPAGGETTFIDSEELALAVKEEAPELMRPLMEHPVLFSKANLMRRTTIFRRGKGELLLNWNYHCVDKAESPESVQLVETFHQFMQTKVVGSRRVLPVNLAPGEMVFWHDERTLHGRNSFTAHKTNDRFLWKTAVTCDPYY